MRTCHSRPTRSKIQTKHACLNSEISDVSTQKIGLRSRGAVEISNNETESFDIIWSSADIQIPRRYRVSMEAWHDILLQNWSRLLRPTFGKQNLDRETTECVTPSQLNSWRKALGTHRRNFLMLNHETTAFFRKMSIHVSQPSWAPRLGKVGASSSSSLLLLMLSSSMS